MGSTFTLYADFNLIDGGSTSTKNVTIGTNTQVIGDGGVIFDNATVALVDGVLQVELPDNTNDPFDFGYTVRRAAGLTKTWRVPVQEPGVRVLLTTFTSTTPLPLPPSGNAVSQTDFTAYEATAAAALAAETTRATAAEAAAVTTAAADATAKVAAETSRATTAEATKVNSSTYTSGQAAQDTALATEATTARAAESANATAITGEATNARAAELALRTLSDSTFATNLSASFGAELNAPAATGANDQVALNAFMAAATSFAYRFKVKGRAGSTYVISGPIIVPSGCELDMTGCKVSMPTAATRMCQNAATLGSGAYDHDVRVVGGYWERTGPDALDPLDRQLIVLHRFHRGGVSDATFHSTANKFAVLLSDFTNGYAERLHFDGVSADGVHVHGPAAGVTVRDISGLTGDDFVAFTGRDYAGYEYTVGGGDITDVLVENLTPDNILGRVCLLLPGAARTLSNVVVSKVGGSSQNTGVAVFEDNVNANTLGGKIRNVHLEDVTTAVPYDRNQVFFNHPDTDQLYIDGVRGSQLSNQVAVVAMEGTAPNVDIRNISTPTTLATDARLVEVRTGANVTNLTLDQVTANLTATGHVVYVAGTARNIKCTKVRIPTATGGTTVQTVSGATVDTITLGDVDAVLQADKAAGRLVMVASTIGKRVTLRGVDSTNGLCLVDIQSGGSIPDTFFHQVVSTAAQLLYHRAANATEAHFSQIDGPATFCTLVGSTGCSITVRAHQIKGTSSMVFRSSSQAVRVVGAEARQDVSTLTPTSGDVCWNTSSAAGAGYFAGPVTYDGGSWVPLRGYAIAGTATLVAGAATVADTKITANSRVRVWTHTPGGTPGALWVDSKTAATGFTIKSTSAADTSIVRYEVVVY